MYRLTLFVPALAVLYLSSFPSWAVEPPADAEKYWGQWRGPDATGVSRQGNPPIEWSETKNVRWKIEIPGKGYGTPVVWGDRLFLLTAVPVEEPAVPTPAPEPQEGGQRRRRPKITPSMQKFVVIAIDRRDGSILWEKTAREELPHEGTHPDGSWASASAITDGQHVYAYFGSHGLYGFDMKGSLVWEVDLGEMKTRRGFGEGSSPALHGDKLVVNWDHEGQSFIVALDKTTGKELWRTNRDEATSWSSPLIAEHGGKAQVITSATNRIRSYDLETGKQIWEASGMTVNTIPTPVAADGMVYATSGFRGSALLAINLADAKGDIDGSGAIVWKYDRDTPYVPSPLLYKDTIYFFKVNSGILSCFNAKTGEQYYGPQRLGDVMNVYASPVGAQDRVYITGRGGTTLVIRHGPKFDVLATNDLDDRFDASPAVVGDTIYLRGHRNLYAIAEE
jgi:outer membrane protein assembly factor BamB